MKTLQQRTPADFTSAIHRDHTLNHVVLAEINFFQKEKVLDLNNYLKTLVEAQIQFYEKVNKTSCFFLIRMNHRCFFFYIGYLRIT